ncbi:MAG: hypothetical protein WBS24_18790 [Terriglobales bacterium]
MTEDEKRHQRAMLLLQHEETRQELEHLRLKAFDLSKEIGEISDWLSGAREMESTGDRQRQRDEKIEKCLSHYRDVFNFDAIVALREELKRVNADLRTLAKQKKDLGLGYSG